MAIEITHVLNDATQELSRQVWRFYFRTDAAGNSPTLLLDRYTQESRPTKRYKWRIDKLYDRIYKRDNNFTIEEIELPDFIVEKAKQELMSQLKVVK